MRRLRALLGCASIGPHPRAKAPPGVVDLAADPEALRAAFDGDVGVPRLVLLLSPA